MAEKLILFDLDGTLTDSAPGITRSIQYAFDRMGYPKYSQAELRTFIGPPLTTQFPDFAGMNKEDTDRAIAYFRERYESIGKFENSVYPGITELLDSLRKEDFLTGMATSKPEHFAAQIADHFGLSSKLDYIQGAAMDESKVSKTDIITEILAKSGFSSHRYDALMVGDRKYDIEGGRSTGVKTVGVTYGFGSREELVKAGADMIADSVTDLHRSILEWAADK